MPAPDTHRAAGPRSSTVRGEECRRSGPPRATRESSSRARPTPGATPLPGAAPRCRRRPRPGTPGAGSSAARARPRRRLSSAANRRRGAARLWILLARGHLPPCLCAVTRSPPRRTGAALGQLFLSHQGPWATALIEERRRSKKPPPSRVFVPFSEQTERKTHGVCPGMCPTGLCQTNRQQTTQSTRSVTVNAKGDGLDAGAFTTSLSPTPACAPVDRAGRIVGSSNSMQI